MNVFVVVAVATMIRASALHVLAELQRGDVVSVLVELVVVIVISIVIVIVIVILIVVVVVVMVVVVVGMMD